VIAVSREPSAVESDASAIARSLREPRAFVAVFEHHHAAIHRFLTAQAGPDAADDLASETFVVAFRRRAEYDGSHPDAAPWLYGIALNLARGQARTERRRLRALVRAAGEGSLPGDEALVRALERVDGAAQRGALRQALARLRPEERDVILLYACAELSYEQLSRALGVPPGTVRSRLHRARTLLRQVLEPAEEG
jgi:RNA polymerase sigma-70 factor (ECF subfamily)